MQSIGYFVLLYTHTLISGLKGTHTPFELEKIPLSTVNKKGGIQVSKYCLQSTNLKVTSWTYSYVSIITPCHSIVLNIIRSVL